MKIQSYNARRAQLMGDKLTIVSASIIAATGTSHAHSELQFSELYDEISFSATMQDDSNCARLKHILYSHPYRWDTITIPCTPEEEAKAYAHAQSLCGTPYDLAGVLGCATPLNIIKPSDDAVWCTEADCECIYVAKPRFKEFMAEHGLGTEIIPSVLDMMARFYFKG